ncbi:MAG: ACT domain-containing protein [Candidatus Lokiarchaeota archaeon]|nr:ACT domain-containing protein [Candidatus Lokiarchaeota archaeon]
MLKQISVFLENTPGILGKFTKVLQDNDINMRALTVAETADFGILRMLVDKNDKCVKILRENNYLVSITDVIAVDIPDKPGALHEIARILGENDINIEYVYSTLVREEAIIVLRVDNIEKATKILEKNGVKLVKSQEF